MKLMKESFFDTLDQEVGISSSTVNSEQLNDKESNLSLLNTLFEDRLSVDTITEDMEASEEIKEKIIFWKTKLSSKIRRINSDSIQVDTVSRNIQVIDSNSFD
ncbi:hypothetical protein TNCV_1468921 [Trichonephila clavipes]|nr:hypothetical protein TNCV_1468921 [Trichonephila clavipes]